MANTYLFNGVIDDSSLEFIFEQLAQLSTFCEHISVEWVAQAVELSTKATIRRRRLPSDKVLWLVV
ncbi:transposase domain-containing protein, partial [Pseudoalteromonas luteoviolacea]